MLGHLRVHRKIRGRAPSAVRTLDGIRTPDGRYLDHARAAVAGREPGAGEAERDRLVHTLMDARRAIGRAKRSGDIGAERAARAQVHRAKVALGERGPVWWDDDAPDDNRRMVENTGYAAWFDQVERWQAAIEALLDQRQPGASICPSEVARAVSPRGWRAHLTGVRDLARHLARRGALAITQRGRVCDPDAPIRGPVRLRRPVPDGA